MRAPGLMSPGEPALGLRPWAHLLRSRGTMARPASPRRLIDSPALRIGQRFAAASKGSGWKTKFHQPDPLWFFRHSVTLLTASAGCPQSEQRSCLHVAARTERAVLIAYPRCRGDNPCSGKISSAALGASESRRPRSTAVL